MGTDAFPQDVILPDTQEGQGAERRGRDWRNEQSASMNCGLRMTSAWPTLSTFDGLRDATELPDEKAYVQLRCMEVLGSAMPRQEEVAGALYQR